MFGPVLVALAFIVMTGWVTTTFIRSRSRASDQGEDSSAAERTLTQEELEEALRRAVREETQALHDRIDRLEQRLPAGRNEPPRPEPPEEPGRYGLIADGTEV